MYFIYCYFNKSKFCYNYFIIKGRTRYTYTNQLVNHVYLNKNCSNLNFIFVCLYRPPSSNSNCFINALYDLLHNLHTIEGKSHHVYCGDFNFNFDVNVCDSNAGQIINNFASFGMSPCIQHYSRVQNNCKSIIDNVLISFSAKHIVTSNIYSDLSDHFMQLVSLPINANLKFIKHYKYVRKFTSEQNLLCFTHLLSSTCWEFLFDVNTDANDKFNAFLVKFLEIFDLAFPQELVCYNSNIKIKKNLWLTPEVVREGANLRMFHQQCKPSNDINLLNTYKDRSKQHKIKICNLKKCFYGKVYDDSDNKSRATWQIINMESNFNKNKHNTFPKNFLNTQNEKLPNDASAAAAFNDYFIDSITGLLSNTSQPASTRLNTIWGGANIFLMPTDEVEVYTLLKSMSSNDSCGEDGIPCSLLSIDKVKYYLLFWLI